MGQITETEYFCQYLDEKMPCKKKKTWSSEALNQKWQYGSKFALRLVLFGQNNFFFFKFELGARNLTLWDTEFQTEGQQVQRPQGRDKLGLSERQHGGQGGCSPMQQATELVRGG